MADFSELHRMFPGMHKRPETILCDKNNLQEEIKSESNKTFLLLKNCADYELKFEGKAAKIMCENCKNLTVTLTDPLISGLFEVHKSNNVLIKLTKSCEIPIFQVDDSEEIKIEVSNKVHFPSICFQRSKNLEVMLNGKDLGNYVIDTSVDIRTDGADDIKQFRAHWDDTTSAYVTDRLKRSGIYPLSE